MAVAYLQLFAGSVVDSFLGLSSQQSHIGKDGHVPVLGLNGGATYHKERVVV